MGVIRKKTVTRGTEGGLKYICDVCSADITSTVSSPSTRWKTRRGANEDVQVRIHCADDKCEDYDLCVQCFSQGAFSREHDPATHSFNVVEQHSIPIYADDWGADEELLLLEGAEVYGLGSWADIADHIGGFRSKDEVRDHYIETYVRSPRFPLPARADPGDMSLIEEVPREEFQARKKRRIEQCKEDAKNAPPLQPKPKPTASVPSCHEVAGFMPGRLEFETEYANEAEEAVQHMQFEPGEGMNPRTGEMDPEMELKMIVMNIYNSKLTQRTTRKRAIFEHDLLEYRKNNAIEKKRTKEERDLVNKVKPLSQVINHTEWVDFAQGAEHELSLRQAIAQLRDWRYHAIGDLKTGEKYEAEKAARTIKHQATGTLDRMPGIRPPKPAPIQETPAATLALTATDLPERLKSTLRPASANKDYDKISGLNGRKPKQPLANGNTNAQRAPFVMGPVSGWQPLKFTSEMADLHLLSSEEKELCQALRIFPKAYLAMKEGVVREALKNGGSLKKKNAREVTRVGP